MGRIRNAAKKGIKAPFKAVEKVVKKVVGIKDEEKKKISIMPESDEWYHNAGQGPKEGE